MITWGEDLARWWLEEVADDPAYEQEVLPLALRVLDPQPKETYLDLGCGDGRVMAALSATGARAIGVDISQPLAATARRWGPVAVGRVPELGFLRDQVVDGVLLVLVIEHIADIGRLLEEAGRVVRSGGVLAIVANHPVFTTPDSGPILDSDGEVLWRWGDYFDARHTDEPAGQGSVRFHHRPMGELLTEAAAHGWRLEAMEEMPVGTLWSVPDPLLAMQSEIPRLIGGRWRK